MKKFVAIVCMLAFLCSLSLTGIGCKGDEKKKTSTTPAASGGSSTTAPVTPPASTTK